VKNFELKTIQSLEKIDDILYNLIKNNIKKYNYYIKELKKYGILLSKEKIIKMAFGENKMDILENLLDINLSWMEDPKQIRKIIKNKFGENSEEYEFVQNEENLMELISLLEQEDEINNPTAPSSDSTKLLNNKKIRDINDEEESQMKEYFLKKNNKHG
jgi:hypothetical protein